MFSALIITVDPKGISQMDKELSLPNHNFEAKDKKGLRRVRKLMIEISDVIEKDDFSPFQAQNHQDGV